MTETVFVFIFGLCLGSFFNVCIYRLPKGKSIVNPPSHCPSCQTPIRWYDNIPVVSYLLLRGRCRDCRAKIPVGYFAVEALTGIIFAFCYIKSGWSFLFVKQIVLFSLCIVVSFIDIEYKEIPGWLCIIGILSAFAISLAETWQVLKINGFYIPLQELPIVLSVKGAMFSVGLAYLLKLFADFGLWVYLKLKKQESIEGEKEALGLGDIDFVGLAGAFLGWQSGFLTFFLAPAVALLYGVYVFIFKKPHIIPYLPFLSLSAFIVAFWGYRIISWLGY